MDLPFPAEDLARLYRFALLMTGEEAAAQQTVYDACVGSAARLGSYRNNESAFACLLENIRVRAKTATGAGVEDAGEKREAEARVESPQAARMARAFSSLPEPERAALGMLYSGLLPAREVAQVLKLPLEQMGAVLQSAREHLQAALEPKRETGLEAAR